jgi:hypothetical protein
MALYNQKRGNQTANSSAILVKIQLKQTTFKKEMDRLQLPRRKYKEIKIRRLINNNFI